MMTIMIMIHVVCSIGLTDSRDADRCAVLIIKTILVIMIIIILIRINITINTITIIIAIIIIITIIKRQQPI